MSLPAKRFFLDPSINRGRILLQLLVVTVLLPHQVFAQPQYGHIQVESEENVAIYLDDEFKGLTRSEIDGLIIQNVPAGTHTIRATKPGFVEKEDVIEVAPGQVFIYKVMGLAAQIRVEQHGDETSSTPPGGVGTISIQSLPVRCEVIMPDYGVHQSKTRDIIMLSNVPAGPHRLRFEALEKTLEHTVDVNADETVLLMVNFIDETVKLQDAEQPDCAMSDDIALFAGIQFRKIPPGRFMMGSPEAEQDRYEDEGRRHRVVFESGFWMGIYPVTQTQWKSLMGSDPSRFSDLAAHLPVEQVSWNDAQRFIEKLNASWEGGRFRLPTEAEWEYACRAGTQTRFYWGDDPDYAEIDAYAWHKGNSNGTTRPVGQKRPNAWGLYDMAGNVWEWCEDDWHENYENAHRDGRARIDSPRGAARVVRGGSWNSEGRNCRSAARLIDVPDNREPLNGLRLVYEQD